MLLRRYNTGYEDGNYSLPAGHVEADETVRQTLIREAKEEVGVEIKSEDITLAHVMHRKGSDSNDERLDFFFTCSGWAGEPKIMEKDKCDDLTWFGLEALPDNTIPYIKEAITLAREVVLYSESG